MVLEVDSDFGFLYFEQPISESFFHVQGIDYLEAHEVDERWAWREHVGLSNSAADASATVMTTKTPFVLKKSPFGGLF